MSRVTNNQERPSNQKDYHSPKLRSFGKVSDLTLTNNPGGGCAIRSGVNQ